MRTMLFATRDDLAGVLQEVTSHRDLRWTMTGTFDPTAPPTTLASWEEIRDLGIATAGSSMSEPSYLITPGDAPEPAIREIRLSAGGKRIAVDQRCNPDSLVLRHGGLFDEGRAVIAGELSSISETTFAKSVMRAFRSAIKKRFHRVHTFWVGPAARELWKNGARLTDSVASPTEYDLLE